MNKVKITAVRKTEYPDMMAKYENPILHACDVLLGQSWICMDGKRPVGMCESAWSSMREFVEALARGEGNFFDGWMKRWTRPLRPLWTTFVDPQKKHFLSISVMDAAKI